MSATEGHFKSMNHALATGMLIAYLLDHGIEVELETADNEEDYTPRLAIIIPILEATVAIEVLPPAEDAL